MQTREAPAFTRQPASQWTCHVLFCTCMAISICVWMLPYFVWNVARQRRGAGNLWSSGRLRIHFGAVNARIDRSLLQQSQPRSICDDRTSMFTESSEQQPTRRYVDLMFRATYSLRMCTWASMWCAYIFIRIYASEQPLDTIGSQLDYVVAWLLSLVWILFIGKTGFDEDYCANDLILQYYYC